MKKLINTYSAKMENMEWKGVGFCKARDRKEAGDFCNNPTIKGGEYCSSCTCDVKGCKELQTIEWPLRHIKLCSKHYKNPPDSVKDLVKASQEPPDDFDIPYDYY